MMHHRPDLDDPTAACCAALAALEDADEHEINSLRKAVARAVEILRYALTAGTDE
jgi:hypothetical protein